RPEHALLAGPVVPRDDVPIPDGREQLLRIDHAARQLVARRGEVLDPNAAAPFDRAADRRQRSGDLTARSHLDPSGQRSEHLSAEALLQPLERRRECGGLLEPRRTEERLAAQVQRERLGPGEPDGTREVVRHGDPDPPRVPPVRPWPPGARPPRRAGSAARRSGRPVRTTVPRTRTPRPGPREPRPPPNHARPARRSRPPPSTPRPTTRPSR